VGNFPFRVFGVLNRAFGSISFGNYLRGASAWFKFWLPALAAFIP
jgi:hypothetical protein